MGRRGILLLPRTQLRILPQTPPQILLRILPRMQVLPVTTEMMIRRRMGLQKQTPGPPGSRNFWNSTSACRILARCSANSMLIISSTRKKEAEVSREKALPP